MLRCKRICQCCLALYYAWHLLRIRIAWLYTELNWSWVKDRSSSFHMKPSWADDFKASCWHVFFKPPGSCVYFMLLTSFSSFSHSCLEVNLPTLLLSCQKKKRTALFQPVSDGELIMWMRWWQLPRPFIKKLNMSNYSGWPRPEDKPWLSSWVSLLNFPNPFCLWAHNTLWISWVSSEVKLRGPASMTMEWGKPSSSWAEIVTLTSQSFRLLFCC